MNRVSPSQVLRELQSLTSNFTKVRILHYAAAGPIDRSAMLLRLRVHHPALTPAYLNRLLTSMVLKGWLKAKATSAADSSAERKYSLTPEGRRMLKTARKHLGHLVDAKLAPTTSS
jgi:hypothetical protein